MRLQHLMRRICRLVGVVLVISLLAACDTPEQRQAKAHVEQVLAALPQLPQVDLIKTTRLQWLAVEGGFACSYTRAYVIIGTQRPAVEVLDAYTEQLPRLGWVLQTESHHLELMPVVRIFIRGRHERLAIGSLVEGTEVADSVDHEALKRAYTTLLVIRVDYMLPQRDEC